MTGEKSVRAAATESNTLPVARELGKQFGRNASDSDEEAQEEQVSPDSAAELDGFSAEEWVTMSNMDEYLELMQGITTINREASGGSDASPETGKAKKGGENVKKDWVVDLPMVIAAAKAIGVTTTTTTANGADEHLKVEKMLQLMAVRITESSHTVEGVLSRIRKAATLKEKQTQREKRRGKGSGLRGINQ